MLVFLQELFLASARETSVEALKTSQGAGKIYMICAAPRLWIDSSIRDTFLRSFTALGFAYFLYVFKGLVAICHSFLHFFFFLYTIDKLIHHSFKNIGCGSVGGTSMGCRAEIRTRACLTASQRTIYFGRFIEQLKYNYYVPYKTAHRAISCRRINVKLCRGSYYYAFRKPRKHQSLCLKWLFSPCNY